MFQPTNPSWWATQFGLLAAIAGVSSPIQGDIKEVISGGAALIIAVYTWQHHKTVRNLDTATATVAAAKAAAAAPLTAPPGSVVAGPYPGAAQVLPLPPPAGSAAEDAAKEAAAAQQSSGAIVAPVALVDAVASYESEASI